MRIIHGGTVNIGRPNSRTRRNRWLRGSRTSGRQRGGTCPSCGEFIRMPIRSKWPAAGLLSCLTSAATAINWFGDSLQPPNALYAPLHDPRRVLQEPLEGYAMSTAPWAKLDRRYLNLVQQFPLRPIRAKREMDRALKIAGQLATDKKGRIRRKKMRLGLKSPCRQPRLRSGDPAGRPSEAVLYPKNQAAITPKIVAPVKKFYVNRGSRVHAGQLLAVIENRDLAAAETETKGSYDQARGRLPNRDYVGSSRGMAEGRVRSEGRQRELRRPAEDL